MKFVFDIDGTLCFNGKSIDPSIVDAKSFINIH
ncbi:haloacid dehalogenase-like hydrolase [Staphylococcus aureus]|nr:haloacid dehalogenase-like hydrolase [Staphylococcus aureus]GBR81739.1 haloacid dehalogenase-like hydrolase [Staphylococcus aureus]